MQKCEQRTEEKKLNVKKNRNQSKKEEKYRKSPKQKRKE